MKRPKLLVNICKTCALMLTLMSAVAAVNPDLEGVYIILMAAGIFIYLNIKTED